MRHVLVTAGVVAALLSAGSTRGEAAVAGYDSAYAGESAFVTIGPGASGQFQVFFANTGASTWRKGTATQVNLAVCLEDKTTCNVESPLAIRVFASVYATLTLISSSVMSFRTSARKPGRSSAGKTTTSVSRTL